MRLACKVPHWGYNGSHRFSKVHQMPNYSKSDPNYRLRNILDGMKRRCRRSAYAQKKSPSYHRKHISICDEWCRSYKTFVAWAHANGYRDDLTIDRIDNDGDYCPENCQWITAAENSAKDRRPSSLTPNLDEIRRLHMEEHWGAGRLSRKYEVDRKTMREFLKKHKIQSPVCQKMGSGEGAMRYSYEEQDEMYRMNKRGVSQEKLARQFNVGKHTIAKYIGNARARESALASLP